MQKLLQKHLKQFCLQIYKKSENRQYFKLKGIKHDVFTNIKNAKIIQKHHKCKMKK